jgi:hypothetical protein
VEIPTRLRTVFALRLFPHAPSEEITDFLSLAQHGFDGPNPWNSLFASWAPDAIRAAQPRPANRIASAIAKQHHDRLSHAKSVEQTWLRRRAEELCGPLRPVTGDLFDTGLPPASTAPEQRLARLIDDPMAPAEKRRDAAEVLARMTVQAAPPPTPSVKILGLLMLVP